jgi:hypothetical protein
VKQEETKRVGGRWTCKHCKHFDPSRGVWCCTRVKHRGKPAEPWAQEGQFGHVVRVTPGYRGVPAQAFVQWDGFTTWEKLADLAKMGG